jgi:hypothetical protein
MKSILAVLASMMTVAAVAGQSSRAPESNRGIVAVGCVNRSAPTGSLAAAPGVAAATPATAGALANSGQDPTDAFVLKGATPPDATDETRTLVAAGRPPTTGLITYVLDGARQDLEKHAGHRVEVRGTLRVAQEGDSPGTKAEVKHIAVASIRMLADACPVASPVPAK